MPASNFAYIVITISFNKYNPLTQAMDQTVIKNFNTFYRIYVVSQDDCCSATKLTKTITCFQRDWEKAFSKMLVEKIVCLKWKDGFIILFPETDQESVEHLRKNELQDLISNLKYV